MTTCSCHGVIFTECPNRPENVRQAQAQQSSHDEEIVRAALKMAADIVLQHFRMCGMDNGGIPLSQARKAILALSIPAILQQVKVNRA